MKIAASSAHILHRALVGTLLVCVLAVLPARCAGQQAPAIYAVEGTVENRVTHQPIARALVEAASDAVLTDSDGHFTLHVPGGFARITARRPGFEDDGASVQGTFHLLQVGPGTRPLTFTLTPSANIMGHVTLSSGDEAGGIQFTLYRRRMEDGRPRWTQEGGTTTWSDGSFRLVSLQAPGSYVICSTPFADDVRTVPSSAKSGYPAACYPGGGDLASATAVPLKLAPGQQAQVEISLARQPLFPVTISVASGGVNGGMPQIFDRSGRPVGFMSCCNERHESFQALPNGMYYAEVRAWGPTPLYARRDFTVAGAPVNFTIAPVPLRKITAEVHEEFTANPDSRRNPQLRMGIVNMRGGRNEPQISLNWIPANKPFDGPFGANLHHPEGSPDSAIYEIDSPQPGTYWVEPNAFGAYISSMTSGATDLLREPLVIGGGAEPIQITLRNDMGQLNWKRMAQPTSTPAAASNGDESQIVFLDCIPLTSNQLRLYRSVSQVSSQGSTLIPLPPGSYLVVGFSSDPEIDLSDPNEMARLAGLGQTVTIQPGATTDIEVNVVSSDVLEASQ